MPSVAARPNSTIVPGRGGRCKPHKMTCGVTFLVTMSLFKYSTESSFNITHSLNICRPYDIHTGHQSGSIANPDIPQLFIFLFWKSLNRWLIIYLNLNKKVLLWRLFGFKNTAFFSACSVATCASTCRPNFSQCVTKCPQGHKTWSDLSFPALCCVSSVKS